MSEESKTIDAVSVVNTLNLGLAPAMAMGQLYNSLVFNTGMASMNLVFATQQAWEAQLCATSRCVSILLNDGQ